MLKCLPSSEYYKWKAMLDEAVPYACASDRWWSDFIKRNIYLSPDWCGLSMYLPKMGKALNEDFVFCEWYKAAGWAEAGW